MMMIMRPKASGVLFMIKDINKSVVHEWSSNIKKNDDKIYSDTLDTDRLKRSINATYNHVVGKGNGFLFDNKEFISPSNDISIDDIVLISVCYRDAAALNQDYRKQFNPAPILNCMLLAAYEINFYTHNLDRMLEHSHRSSFDQWMEELSIENHTHQTLDKVALESKAKLDRVIDAGDEKILSLYHMRHTVLWGQVETVEQYIKSMSTGFFNLFQNIDTFSLNDQFLMDEYLSGLKSLSKHAYSADTVNRLNSVTSSKYNEILYTSVPSLSLLTKNSDLLHSGPTYNNLILDSGDYFVEKSSHFDCGISEPSFDVNNSKTLTPK